MTAHTMHAYNESHGKNANIAQIAKAMQITDLCKHVIETLFNEDSQTTIGYLIGEFIGKRIIARKYVSSCSFSLSTTSMRHFGVKCVNVSLGNLAQYLHEHSIICNISNSSLVLVYIYKMWLKRPHYKICNFSTVTVYFKVILSVLLRMYTVSQKSVHLFIL